MITGKIRIVVLFIITVMLLFNYSPNISYACSCVEPGTTKEELARNSVVFSGKVVGIVDQNKDKPIQSSADPIAILFEVEESWKGLAQTQVVVYSERDSSSCGYEFALNEEYLVYADEIDGELRVSLCSRTTPLLAAKEDIDELGIGEKSTEQVVIDLDSIKVENQVTFENPSNNKLTIILLIIGLVIVVVYVAQRKKK